MMDYRHYSYPGNLLEGRIILITGASDGIGRALAVHAAGHGARVILHGRNASKLEKVSPRPSIAVMDLGAAGSDAYTSLADSLADEFGRLDGLVNNAGILGERYSIEQYDAAMWQQVMHVNVTAAFAITQVCLPLLRQSAEGLSQVLASELEHSAIRVNCINPGPVRTEMRRAAYPAEDRDELKTAEEILPAYMFLLGPDSKGVTGKSLDAQ
jgi:NAD(P)-dependent dehydrogenase (short-subunit alcohol dehydrogenase family)